MKTSVGPSVLWHCEAVRHVTLVLLVLGLIGPLAGCGDFPPFRAARIASASTSQTLCDAAFVSGIDPDQAYRDEIRPAPGMSVIAWAMHYEVNRERREVVTTIAGRARSRVVFKDGYGCVIAYGDGSKGV